MPTLAHQSINSPSNHKQLRNQTVYNQAKSNADLMSSMSKNNQDLKNKLNTTQNDLGGSHKNSKEGDSQYKQLVEQYQYQIQDLKEQLLAERTKNHEADNKSTKYICEIERLNRALYD